MPERIEPVGRRPDGVRDVPHVDRLRLLSPAEREEARRKREEARRRAAERESRPGPKRPPQVRGGGADYLA